MGYNHNNPSWTRNNDLFTYNIATFGPLVIFGIESLASHKFKDKLSGFLMGSSELVFRVLWHN